MITIKILSKSNILLISDLVFLCVVKPTKVGFITHTNMYILINDLK